MMYIMLKNIYTNIQNRLTQISLSILNRAGWFCNLLSSIPNKLLKNSNINNIYFIVRSLLMFGLLHLSLSYFLGAGYVAQGISFSQNLVGINMGPFLYGVATIAGNLALVFASTQLSQILISGFNFTLSRVQYRNTKMPKSASENKQELNACRAIDKYNPIHPNVKKQREQIKEKLKQDDPEFVWQGANSEMGVTSEFRSIFPTIFMNASSPKSFVKFSSMVQAATFGLVKPGNLLVDVPTDDFGSGIFKDIIRMDDNGETLQALMDSISKSKLYELLDKKDISNESVLDELINHYDVKNFEIVLKAIEPDKRLYYLTREEGVLDSKSPLVFNAGSEDWDILRAELTSEQIEQLLLTKNQRGDNLIQASSRKKEILLGCTIEQRKQALTELCPHGASILFGIIKYWSLARIDGFFKSVLPKEDFTQVLQITPQGWSMTLGEKMMVFFHAYRKIDKSNSRRNVNYQKVNDLIQYFKDNFNIDLPAAYQDLTSEELSLKLECFKKNTMGDDCETRHGFMKQYGVLPEELLAMKETYALPAQVHKAYIIQQRSFHPDKQKQSSGAMHQSTRDMSQQINAANKFLTDRDECEKYDDGSSAEYSQEVFDLKYGKPATRR